MSYQKAIQAVISTIPPEIRTCGQISVITDSVMDSLRRIAPEVIYAIVMAHGPGEHERKFQLLEGGRPYQA